MKLSKLYEGNYKRFLIMPIVLLIVCGFLAFVFPGVPKGIDLSGGTMILIRSEKQLDAVQTEQLLSENFDLIDLSVVATSSPLGENGLTIRFAENAPLANAENQLSLAEAALKTAPQTALQHANAAVELLQDYVPATTLSDEPEKAVAQVSDLLVDAKEAFNRRIQQLITERFNLERALAFQKKEVSPTLGTAFYQTALNVAIFALVLVVIVIFLFFRKIVPSAAVIASALLDIVGALGLMAVFQIPLTLSSIPALLMLLGYSIDTDVMLTTKILQKQGQSASARAYEALVTGLTMHGTTMAALAVMILLSFAAQMQVVFEIAAVLFLGLLIDLSSTWFMNAPVLLWYNERSANKK